MQGDRIISVNEHMLTEQNSIPLLLKSLKEQAGETVTFTVERTTEAVATTLSIPVTLNGAAATAQLGASFAAHEIAAQSFGAAIGTSSSIIYTWMAETFGGLRTMLKKRTTQGLGGPIAIIHGMAQSAHHGLSSFLLLLCFISVGLACLNLIPLPIFDGGQVLFYTLEALVQRPLESARIIINYLCWALVLVAFIYLSWQDIIRIISGQ